MNKVGLSVKFSIPLKVKPSVVEAIIDSTKGAIRFWKSSIEKQFKNNFLNFHLA